MRIGILGGTMDPVHNGHIAIAQAARRLLALDKVVLLPAGMPPHKPHPTDRIDRWNMARIAAGSAGLTASDDEIFREGVTYTVDTMRRFHAAEPDAEWHYIIGSDTLRVLDTWKDFAEVAKLTCFTVMQRPGGPEKIITEQRAVELREKYGATIRLLDYTGPDISSTEIRALAAEGRPLDAFMPPEEAEYIRDHGLYLTSMPLSDVKADLQARLSAHRWMHTLGVADTALGLAIRHGVDHNHAYIAGLLHDVAKPLSYEELAKLVRGRIDDLDEQELASEPVLHAPASAVLARDMYGVRHPDILSAIRRHTLGGPGMTDLEALIYVSDFIEPTRQPFPGLEEARTLAQTDLHAAARRCARLTVEYVRSRGQEPHPRQLEMLKETI